MLEDEIVQAVVNLDQAFVGGAGGGVFDGAGGHDDRFFGGAFEDGVSCGPQGWVESQDSHKKSVPTGARMSREADGLGLTHKKRSLF